LTVEVEELKNEIEDLDDNVSVLEDEYPALTMQEKIE
jgi:hypothetical protein